MPGSIGSALSSLGTMAPSFLGGGSGGFLGNAGSALSAMAPTVSNPGITAPLPDSVPTSLPASWDPSQPVPADSGMGAGTSPSPAGATAIPPAAPDLNAQAQSVTSGMANAFMNPDTSGVSTDPAIQAAAAGGTPADQSWWKTLLFGNQQGTGTGTGTATGTGPSKAGWPGLLSATGLQGIASGGTDLMKYLQQRSLENPSSLAQAQQQLAQQQKAMLRKSIFPAVTATGQETGNINSPYLMSQAYTTAAAPIVSQQNEEALNQWLQANQIASGMYPGTSALGGFVEPNIFGGGASA